MERRPVAMPAVFLVTLATTWLGAASPAIQSALERSPRAIENAEYWRLVTPLFVHDEGWRQILFNLSSLAVLGIVVERRIGAARSLVLYFVSGFVGELAGLAWKPVGAGASVAVAGLAGSVVVSLLRHQLSRFKAGGAVGVCGAIVLTLRQDLHGPPLLAGMALALLQDRVRWPTDNAS